MLCYDDEKRKISTDSSADSPPFYSTTPKTLHVEMTFLCRPHSNTPATMNVCRESCEIMFPPVTIITS